MSIADSVDDAISEYGWAAVREGLHMTGREPTPAAIAAANKKHGRRYDRAALGEPPCQHVYTEGHIVSVCVACGDIVDAHAA